MSYSEYDRYNSNKLYFGSEMKHSTDLCSRT